MHPSPHRRGHEQDPTEHSEPDKASDHGAQNGDDEPEREQAEDQVEHGPPFANPRLLSFPTPVRRRPRTVASREFLVRLVRVCAYVVFWGRVKDGPGRGIGRDMSLEEASRQLEAAIHDARVSFDCILLEQLDRAHTNAITARAAVDAAENALRAELEKKAEAERESAD